MKEARAVAMPGDIALTVSDDIAAVRADWRALAAGCDSTVYATPSFIEPWARNVADTAGLRPRIFLARRGGEPVAIIPLALGRHGGVPMLVNLSDTHSNFNEGLFEPGWNVAPAALHDALLALEPEAQGLWLCCVPIRPGAPPALVAAPRPSVHDAHGGRLDEGFAAHLARNNGRRKRKKHRQSARRFEEAGGWTVRRIVDPDDAVAKLDLARALYAKRFAREGIDDPFASEAVRRFMAEALRASCDADRPSMALWVLEIAGRVTAIQCGGGSGGRFSLMFTVYRPSEFDSAAPGEFLLHEVIEKAAEAGYASFDLGRGREPYKISWCDETIPLHDVRVARTARARLWMAAHSGALAVKRRVRESDRLWSLAKTVRRRLARAA